VDVDRTSVWIGDECAFRAGSPTDVDTTLLSRAMEANEVRITVDVGLGSHSATAWGCDLTEEYIRINADYTT
jgi:glutamate N-acetyltransferase/amino-acid N-acetyltransferase